MTGNIVPGSICFTLLGKSFGHILETIVKLHPSEIVIFTSPEIHDKCWSKYREIEEYEITIRDIVLLNPFEDSAIEKMTYQMIRTYRKIIKQMRNSAIVSLNGGTNLMAIAMGLFALMEGIDAYYIKNNPEQEIQFIPLFKSLNQLSTISDIRNAITEKIK